MKYPVRCCVCRRSLGECWSPLPYSVCPECALKQHMEIQEARQRVLEGKE